MDEDEVHEAYIDIVANNWTPEQYDTLARLIRSHFVSKIWKESGADGRIFTKLWMTTWSLSEEIVLAGAATSIESHPYDDDLR